ncbi:MAG: hypothetical protein ACWGQW_16720 [bacterium]
MQTWPHYTLTVGRKGGKPEVFPHLVVNGLAEHGKKTVAKCKKLKDARMLCHLLNRIYHKQKTPRS